MLPTLAERLREQQAKSRSRRPSRQPWPLPTEPPTALLFQPRQHTADPITVATPEAVASPEPVLVVTALKELEIVLPTPPQTRTVLAEALLLLFWAVLVLIDGALVLASLIDRVAPRERRRPGLHRQRITPAASSSAGVSDPPEDMKAKAVLQRCRSLAASL